MPSWPARLTPRGGPLLPASARQALRRHVVQTHSVFYNLGKKEAHREATGLLKPWRVKKGTTLEMCRLHCTWQAQNLMSVSR